MTWHAGPFDPHAVVVLGQPDFTSWGANRAAGCNTLHCAGPPAADTLSLDDARMAFDGRGRLWVSDKENNRVLRYDPPFRTGMAASLVLGQPNFTANQPNQGRGHADLDTLFGPMGLGFDPGPDGQRGTDDDRLWVVEQQNNRLLRFDPPFADGMAPSVVLGQPNVTCGANNRCGALGRMEPVRDGFSYPGDLAIDASGNLWVVVRENHRVLLYRAPIDESCEVPGANAAAGAVLGQPDFRSRNFHRGEAGPVANGFRDPRSIEFDPAGNLWVVDNDNERVLRFAPFDLGGEVPGGSDAADLVLGQPDFTSSAKHRGEGTPVRDGFNQAIGIATDAQSNVWISDMGTRAVRYDAPINASGPVPGAGDGAELLLGRPDFDGRAPPGWKPGEARGDLLIDANGLLVDPDGRLWVAEHSDRVLRFCPGA